MLSRLFLITLTLSLFIAAHVSPSFALSFTQDSFVFHSQWQLLGNTIVELAEIDPATQSFQLTASGSIANLSLQDPEYLDGGSSSIPWINLPLVSFDPGGPEFIGGSVLGSELPDGASASFRIRPMVATLSVGFPSPALMEPFTWSATFEITTTELLGSYTLFQYAAHMYCTVDPGCDGHSHESDDEFGFAIVPEPSAALVFALGVVIVSQAGRRAGRSRYGGPRREKRQRPPRSPVQA